ncbi:hypothetical protein [Burkholderia ubonensis]|uniref:hypothetical protein n=1 Tax=Burkholderia ubonensis TaxID=101571 RepID=UPI000AF2AC8C|nr:hypothetical protein [Burkholderia ubonensis]
MSRVIAVARLMAWVVSIAVIVLLGMAAVSRAAFFLIPEDVASELDWRIAKLVGVRVHVFTSRPTDEVVDADLDHGAVGGWVNRCWVAERKHTHDPITDSDLRLKYPRGMNSWEISLDSLSSSIIGKRRAADKKLSSAYVIAQAGSFLSILIGLLTTILVALSSSEVGKRADRMGVRIRVGALVMPAIGTAVAAVIAFYDPYGNLARQSQLASGLQQLHKQIAFGVLQFDCPKSATSAIPGPYKQKLDLWTQKYQELLASTVDGRSQQSTPTEKKN